MVRTAKSAPYLGNVGPSLQYVPTDTNSLTAANTIAITTPQRYTLEMSVKLYVSHKPDNGSAYRWGMSEVLTPMLSLR